MRSDAMVAPAGTERPSSRAINPDYRTGTEILTRSGGLVMGLILLLVGFLWFGANAGWIPPAPWFDLVVPFLVIVGGIYLLVTKLMR